MLRQQMAMDLADHFVTCNCPVADAIVTELVGEKAMEELKYCHYGEVFKILTV